MERKKILKEADGSYNFDRIIALASLLIAIIALIPTLKNFIVLIPYNTFWGILKSLLLFLTINPFFIVLFLSIIFIFWLYFLKDIPNRKFYMYFLFSLFFVNVTLTYVILNSPSNNARLYEKAMSYEKSGNLNDALQLIRVVNRFSDNNYKFMERRIFAKYQVARAAFNHYKTNSTGKMTLKRLELLSQAYSLNRDYQKEVKKIINSINDLSSEMERTIELLRNENENEAILILEKINISFPNFAYSNDILIEIKGHQKKNDGYLKLILNKSRSVNEINQILTNEFKLLTKLNIER